MATDSACALAKASCSRASRSADLTLLRRAIAYRLVQGLLNLVAGCRGLGLLRVGLVTVDAGLARHAPDLGFLPRLPELVTIGHLDRLGLMHTGLLLKPA